MLKRAMQNQLDKTFKLPISPTPLTATYEGRSEVHQPTYNSSSFYALKHAMPAKYMHTSYMLQEKVEFNRANKELTMSCVHLDLNKEELCLLHRKSSYMYLLRQAQ